MTIRTTSIFPLILAVLTVALGCGNGSPAGSPWVGHTYLVTPADPYTYLTKPSSSTIAKTLANFIPNFLLQVNGVSGSQFAITIAPAKKQTNPPEQDLCNVSVDVDATMSSYQKIQIGPTDLPIYITNSPEDKPPVTAKTTVRELSLSDVLPNGSTVSETGKFSALVDAREVNTLITIQEGLSGEQVCNLMKDSFATDCVPCPDSQILCLQFEAEALGATETETNVKSMTESDLDSSCPKP